MTAGPSAGPSSAYPTLRRPASICFKERNDVFVPGLIAGSCADLVVFCCAPAEPMMPSCAAAMLVAAAPRKRRRSWLMPATVPISSIMSLPVRGLSGRTPGQDFERSRPLRFCLKQLADNPADPLLVLPSDL